MNIQPVRIQRSRKHKQVSPNGLPIQYVGRPGKWGNPYILRKRNLGGSALWTVRVAPEVCQSFDSKSEAAASSIADFKLFIIREIGLKQVDISELRGKNLSCWCKIGDPCHADILLELANQTNQ